VFSSVDNAPSDVLRAITCIGRFMMYCDQAAGHYNANQTYKHEGSFHYVSPKEKYVVYTHELCSPEISCKLKCKKIKVAYSYSLYGE
jgi:hypothetical protein